MTIFWLFVGISFADYFLFAVCDFFMEKLKWQIHANNILLNLNAIEMLFMSMSVRWCVRVCDIGGKGIFHFNGEYGKMVFRMITSMRKGAMWRIRFKGKSIDENPSHQTWFLLHFQLFLFPIQYRYIPSLCNKITKIYLFVYTKYIFF